jgi:nitroreductase
LFKIINNLFIVCNSYLAMEFDNVINERKSVRKFKSKKPDWKEIITAVESALKTPLAGNIPTLKFVLVDDSQKISKIAKATQQDFVAQVHYLVVVCNDPTDVARSYAERGERYAAQQAGAAIEQFLLKLVDLGLSGCWIGAFVEDQVKRTLKIPAAVKVEAVIPIGYSMDKSGSKRKPDLDRSLRFNEYDAKLMKPRKQVEGL